MSHTPQYWILQQGPGICILMSSQVTVTHAKVWDVVDDTTLQIEHQHIPIPHLSTAQPWLHTGLPGELYKKPQQFLAPTTSDFDLIG